MLWNVTYGGTAHDICYTLVETPNQELYLAGSTESFGAGEEDVWIVKTYASGIEIWNSTYGGPMLDICYDLIESGTGDYTFVGTTENSDNLIADGYIASIHENGSLIWETMFGGRLFDIGYAVTECQDGGYAITGHTFDGSDWSSNLLLTRISSEGEFLWSKSYGTSNDDEGRSILQAENEDFVLVGFTNRYIDSGLTTHSTAFAMRVSDTQQGILPPRQYGPPDFGLISAGCGLAILTLLGAYLMLIRSRSTQSQRDQAKLG
jgi:hypothetical protein